MENQIWQGLDEIKSFSILSRDFIENNFEVIVAAVGNDKANSLFSGLKAIAQKAVVCQGMIETIEFEQKARSI